MLLSLFSGAGGLDLGFEQAGFATALAVDRNASSVQSYNANRPSAVASRLDLLTADISALDDLHGTTVQPAGVIGGPPCQSFSISNKSPDKQDLRSTLPLRFAGLLKALNERHSVDFFVFENVPYLASTEHRETFNDIVDHFQEAGFSVHHTVLNAQDFGTPQNRERLFLIGFNSTTRGEVCWTDPAPTTPEGEQRTVRQAIGALPEPVFFARDYDPATNEVHPNHWCMQPKSAKFSTPGALRPGNGTSRSFKTLSWDKPSYTVAYGNREVHVHPDLHRRLSVYEAMRLQGFPEEYVLHGTLSSQITQVSDAVPPPLAHAVANQVKRLLED